MKFKYQCPQLCSLVSMLSIALYSKSYQREYVNEWACLMYNKIVFTNTGNQPKDSNLQTPYLGRH